MKANNLWSIGTCQVLCADIANRLSFRWSNVQNGFSPQSNFLDEIYQTMFAFHLFHCSVSFSILCVVVCVGEKYFFFLSSMVRLIIFIGILTKHNLDWYDHNNENIKLQLKRLKRKNKSIFDTRTFELSFLSNTSTNETFYSLLLRFLDKRNCKCANTNNRRRNIPIHV